MDEPHIMIHVPTNSNTLLEQALERINSSEEIYTMWEMTNGTAQKRMVGWPDHGPVHFQIVANCALRMLRILHKHQIPLGMVKDYNLTPQHAELVVVLASLFHDFGMMINRQGHEEFSLFLAYSVMQKILDFLPVRERILVTGDTLHAIINHRDDGRPLTVEAGIVRVADALDMSEGRSRIPISEGGVNIHSLSHSAIDQVEILDGQHTPLEITIFMNNSTGLFQVDELLKQKLKDSGIEKYCTIKAYVTGQTEKKLLTEFVLGQHS